MNDTYQACYVTDIYGKEYLVAYTRTVDPSYYINEYIKIRKDLKFHNPPKKRIETVRVIHSHPNTRTVS